MLGRAQFTSSGIVLCASSSTGSPIRRGAASSTGQPASWRRCTDPWCRSSRWRPRRGCPSASRTRHRCARLGCIRSHVQCGSFRKLFICSGINFCLSRFMYHISLTFLHGFAAQGGLVLVLEVLQWLLFAAVHLANGVGLEGIAAARIELTVAVIAHKGSGY